MHVYSPSLSHSLDVSRYEKLSIVSIPEIGD